MKKITNKIININSIYVIISLFVFLIFSYITKKTPITGDDWGYAIGGMEGHPLKKAIEFYFTWSGRFFSEYWSFVVCCRKWLWNIINPFLFSGIYILMYKITRTNKNHFLVCLFIIASMLFVNNSIRMQTYTWITGAIYPIPLFFALLYFILNEEIFANDYLTKKMVIVNILSNIVVLLAGIWMENISGAMVLSILILLVVTYLKNKKATKYVFVNFIFSVMDFIVMRCSPGAASRLIRDNPEWVSLNVMEKIVRSYPNFIKVTFLENGFIIAMFSIALIYLMLTTKKMINKLMKILMGTIIVVGLISVSSMYFGTFVVNDYKTAFSLLFWPIYVIDAFVVIMYYMENSYLRNKVLFFVVIGGGSSLAMLLSPFYHSRSAIYFVYFLTIATSLIIKDLNINSKTYIYLSLIFLLACLYKTKGLINIYKSVEIAQNNRLSIIEYYKLNPQDEDVWIPRFPKNTIHSADIEADDLYHMEAFKNYFELPQDFHNIVFYFAE